MTTSTPEWNLDRLPVGIWVARVPDGVAVYANPAFVEILGVPASPEADIDEAPAVYGLCDHDGRPYPVERLPFSRVVATGAAVEVDDIVIHRPDQRRVFIRALAAPTLDSAGRMTHVAVAFTDISREVSAERARATLENQLKLAVDHAPIALFSIDRTGTITLSEGAGLTALGVRSGELVGQSVFDLYATNPAVVDNIRRGLAGESLQYTVTVGAVTFDTWLAPQRDPSGAVVGVIGVSTDVSELHKLQAAAIQSDRLSAMGTLAASIAHEINNPLTFVLAALDGLDRALARPAPRGADEATRMTELIATARTGVDRIASITRDLTTFSRPDDTRRGPVHLADVVRGFVRMARKEVEARATLELILDDCPAVSGNDARLIQVVMNLVMNALHAVEGGGAAARIEVRTRAEGAFAILEVADNGPGIPPDQRERIFEPFFTTKPVGEGTGLGLFVCRNLVRELGGQISAHDRPGGGALLRVALPASRQGAMASSGVDAARTRGEPGARLLVIDDEPLIGEVMVAALRDEGFEAETIADGARALERLLVGPPVDLVLCDLMMPGMTGMRLADLLTEQAPALLDRVVFMTGGGFTPGAAAFVESRADDVVSKPFDVVAEVRRRLAGRTGKP